MWAIGLGAILLTLPVMAQRVAGQKAADSRVEKAFLDAETRVHVRWSGQPEQVMERDHSADQCDGDESHPCVEASASQLIVSADRRSVGWTAEYYECCQNYPIPFVLVIAREGGIVQRIQVGLGIFDWGFVDGGRKVALFYDTAHSDLRPTCVLYDAQTWKQISTWYPGKSVVPPRWAKSFVKDMQ